MLVLVIGHVINLSFIDERKNIYYKRIQEGENPEYLKKHTVCTYIEYSVTCILFSIFFLWGHNNQNNSVLKNVDL